MEFNETLKARHSVRQYTGAPVSEDEVREVIAAASLAPSWKNSQARRYYAALSPEARARVLEHVLPEGNAKKAAGAGALLITTCKKHTSGLGMGEDFANELEDGWAIYDQGLADENLVLKAADMGLATLIMGIRDAEQARKAFAIPEDEIVVAVIALGHPAENPPARPRKPLDEILKVF